MKKYLIFILLFLTQPSLRGQANMYHPFPDSNAVWKTTCNGLSFGCSSCCSGICVYQQESVDSIGGDTIIGTFTYKKLFTDFYKVDYFTGPTTCPPGCFPNSTITYGSISYKGGIRQDTTARKVYFVFPSSSQDTLLYDFSLNVGDTLSQTAIINSENNYVLKIDSVLVGILYRKRFWLWTVGNTPPSPGSNGYVAIIEGIGSEFGLFSELVEPFENSCSIACVKINSATVYPDTNIVCDGVPSTIYEKENAKLVSIFPNPANMTVNIVATINTSIEIRDLSGKLISSFVTDKENIVIDTHAMENGIYTISVGNESLKLVLVK